MTQQHPIIPPPELLQRIYDMPKLKVIEEAFQAGADYELSSCCEWLAKDCSDDYLAELRKYRRPKPPSLKEQSIALIDRIQTAKKPWDISELDTIRRALEQLDDN